MLNPITPVVLLFQRLREDGHARLPVARVARQERGRTQILPDWSWTHYLVPGYTAAAGIILLFGLYVFGASKRTCRGAVGVSAAIEVRDVSKLRLTTSAIRR